MNKSGFRGKSFGEILDLNKGAGLGFDILRLALSVVILMSHTSGIIGTRGFTSQFLADLFNLSSHVNDALNAVSTAGVETIDRTAVKGLGRPFTISHVPMFFALSGFLVAGSAFRTRNLIRFLGLRVLRILPALFVEVALSALLLGAIFTTLPLGEYFSHPLFFAYFWNIIGDVHLHLPGVFEGTSASPFVNANLWTLPSEFECYVIISVLMVSTLLFKRMVFTAAFLALSLALLVLNVGYGYQVTAGRLEGPMNVYYFFVGVMFFLWRYEIKYRFVYFLFAIPITYALMMSTKTIFIYPALLTYITVFIGLSPLPQFKLLKTGDYSYGIYLYGYPVTQGLVAAMPWLKTNFVAAQILALVTTAAFALFSWHAVEKHVLTLKRFLSPKSSKINDIRHPDALPDGDTFAPEAVASPGPARA